MAGIQPYCIMAEMTLTRPAKAKIFPAVILADLYFTTLEIYRSLISLSTGTIIVVLNCLTYLKPEIIMLESKGIFNAPLYTVPSLQ